MVASGLSALPWYDSRDTGPVPCQLPREEKSPPRKVVGGARAAPDSYTWKESGRQVPRACAGGGRTARELAADFRLGADEGRGLHRRGTAPRGGWVALDSCDVQTVNAVGPLHV